MPVYLYFTLYYNSILLPGFPSRVLGSAGEAASVTMLNTINL